jgi:hypothetical protein
MEHFENFKKNVHNPYNIKGFYSLFNNSNVKEGVNIEDIEARIVGEAVKVKIDPQAEVNKILSSNKIPLTTGPTHPELQKSNGWIQPQPSSYPVSSPFTSTAALGSFDFVKNTDYTTNYTMVPKSTLEKKMDFIQLERLRCRCKELLKELKTNDKEFDCDPYYNIIQDPEVDQMMLEEVRAILEVELSGYEGRSFISDGIVAVLGIAEKYFDGSTSVMGHKIDLTGLADTTDVSLRKRKMETTAVYRDVKEKIGIGPYLQLGFDIAVNVAITAQKNSSGATDTQRAVRTKERMKSDGNE